VNTVTVEDGDSNDEHDEYNPLQTKADEVYVTDEITVTLETSTEHIDDAIIFNDDGIIEKLNDDGIIEKPETAFKLTGFILYKKMKKRGMMIELFSFKRFMMAGNRMVR